MNPDIDLPPTYDEPEIPDYEIDAEDRVNQILDDMNIKNYDDVDKQLARTETTPIKARNYLKKKLLKKLNIE